MNKILQNITNTFFSKEVHFDFLMLFAKNEGKELLGKKFINFWVLLGILLLTFLTIGFANGSLQYLQKKMSDPFVNWVSISVPYGRDKDIPDIKRELQNEENIEKYGINTISGYFGLITRFGCYDSNLTYFANGRSISFDSPLLSQVHGEKNFIGGRRNFEEKSIGLIITKNLLDKLNYDGKNPFVYMALTLDSASSIKVPLPIISIVEELPGLYEYAFTPFFYSQRNISSNSNPFRFDQKEDGRLDFFIADNDLTEFQADSLVKEFCFTGDYSQLMPMSTVSKDTTKITPGVKVNISFFPNPDQTELNRIFDDLKASEFFKFYSLYREYPFRFEQTSSINQEYHYLSIHFNELNKIRDFREYMSGNFDLDIDMSLIESKENYSFISSLTRILSVILLVFSVLALTLYSSNVFIRHLEKIRMNLGTFKAFGLDNRLLKRIYLTLIFSFVFGGIVISIAISALLGSLGIITHILNWVNFSLDPTYNLFSLNSIWTIVVVFIILFTLMTVLVYVTNKLLKKSPGDLIYKR